MKKTSIFETLSFSVLTLLRNRVIFIPFLCFLGMELLCLAVLLLAPQPPFNTVLGPMIRTLWGEQFLHYPAHFLLIPVFDFKAKLVITLVYGPIMAACAILLIARAYQGKKAEFRSALRESMRSYAPAFTIIAAINLLAFLIHKGTTWGTDAYFRAGHQTLLQLPHRVWHGALPHAIDFMVIITLQTIFVYSIPMVVLQKMRPFESLRQSAAFARSHPGRTLVYAVMPQTLTLPALLLLYKAPVLVYKFFPEAVLLVSVFGAVVAVLIVDVIVTTATTHSLLKTLEKEHP